MQLFNYKYKSDFIRIKSMENLNLISKDVLILMYLFLEFSDIKSLVSSNKKLCKLLWNNSDFWKHKFTFDYGLHINYNGEWKLVYLSFLRSPILIEFGHKFQNNDGKLLVNAGKQLYGKQKT